MFLHLSIRNSYIRVCNMVKIMHAVVTSKYTNRRRFLTLVKPKQLFLLSERCFLSNASRTLSLSTYCFCHLLRIQSLANPCIWRERKWKWSLWFLTILAHEHSVGETNHMTPSYARGVGNVVLGWQPFPSIALHYRREDKDRRLVVLQQTFPLIE